MNFNSGRKQNILQYLKELILSENLLENRIFDSKGGSFKVIMARQCLAVVKEKRTKAIAKRCDAMQPPIYLLNNIILFQVSDCF